MATGFRSLLREPTLHFALLAGVLFAVTATIGTKDDKTIQIPRTVVDVAEAQIASDRGTPLSAEERQAVEETLIQQEILVREAFARGLERDDPQIRDILVQKMLHVLSADVIQPTDAELTAYYEANRERYEAPRVLTVDEIVVPTEGALPPDLQRQLEQGVPVESLVSKLPLSSKHLPDASLEDLTLVFGPETAALVAEAEPGRWVGPHRTVRGQHWFRVVEGNEARALPFEEIREQLRLDWVAEQENDRLKQRVTELRNRYRAEITTEDSAP